jgi:MFS family permease
MNDLIVRRFERYYGLSASGDAERAACRQLTTITTTPAPFMRRFYWQFPFPRQNPSQQSADYNLVQRDTATFNVKNAFATLIPSVVTFIIFGSNSDLIGRRPLLVLPFIGKIVRYILMIIIVARDLSNTWLIVTQAIEAIFGSSGLSLLSAFSYITDCTDKTRTRAFFITEVMLVIARIIPVLAIGLWLRHHSYIGPLSVDLGLSVIGLFYSLFIQPESVESV